MRLACSSTEPTGTVEDDQFQSLKSTASELVCFRYPKLKRWPTINLYSVKVRRLQFLHRKIGLPIHRYESFAGRDFHAANPHVRRYFVQCQSLLYSVRVESVAGTPLYSKGVQTRAHGLSESQVHSFVEAVPSDRAHFRVQLTDYFHPTLAGHIISTSDGLVVEAIRGELMALSQGWGTGSDLIHATWHFPAAGMRYSCQSPALRELIWGAVRHLLGTSSQAIAPRFPQRALPGYFEFVYSPETSFRFVDFNQSELFAAAYSLRMTLDS